MAKYVISGGNKLKGTIKVSGSKNAALKMLAACILNENKCTLFDVPKISDIEVMKKIIENLGGKIDEQDNTLQINCQDVKIYHPKDDLVNLMRASVVTIGPLLSRFGKVEISKPGGCIIGVRSIDTHVNAFKQLSVMVSKKDNNLIFKAPRKKGGVVVLDEMSVTATENMMMYLALMPGESEIRVAASEPEITDLANFLNKMGAKISGAGNPTIKIRGVNKLRAAAHKVIPDRIEAGTLIIAAAITNGNVIIENVIPAHLSLFLSKLKEIKVNFKEAGDKLILNPQKEFRSVYIDTRPYPGFSTDLQAPMAVLLTQAHGKSRIFETLFEGRFNYVSELKKMGAKIKIADSHNIEITGPSKLKGTKLTSSDLRAGACLILAALTAKGESVIENIDLIERGYENLDARLNQLGADIKRIP